MNEQIASIRHSFRRLLAVLAAFLFLAGAAWGQSLLPGSGAPATEPEAATPADGTALADLIEVLKDDAQREALIAELEKASAAAEGEASAEDPPAERNSIGGQIATVTEEAAERAVDTVTGVWSSFRSARTLLRGLQAETWQAALTAVIDLAVIIIVTVATYILLRLATVPLLRRIGRATVGAGMIPGLLGLVATIVIRVAVVLLTWAIAYGVATLAIGGFGDIGLNQTLFLNAFLAVELTKVAVRTVFSPAADDLRGLPMSDGAARQSSRIAGLAISILGYGVLLFVPIVDEAVSFFAARAVSVLVVGLTLAYLAGVVIWHRREVGAWLVDSLLAPAAPKEPLPDAPVPTAHRQSALAGILYHWHWFVLFYLAVLLIQSFTRSVTDMGQTGVAAVQIGAAAFLGTVAVRYLGRQMRGGITLPERVRLRLPLLEGRLNSVVPKLLFLLRVLVTAAVALFTLDRLGVATIGAWFDSDAGLNFTGNFASVAVIALVSWGIWLALSSWVDYRLNPDYGGIPSSRETTLLTLLRNAATVAIVTFGAMFVLSEIGLNIGPLLASAGVLGLAIGFGAQKMVQDIITGIFIQFENAINVGDVITVAGTTGAVEKLTIRSVSLRDVEGVFHIVPFSSVDMVSNFTREFSYYLVDMGVAYGADVEGARQAMLDAYDALRVDPEQGAFLLGDMEWFGVQAFGDNAVVLRARIKTWPGKQWGVGRAYNRLMKGLFDERGIEIPFPHRTITFGDPKDERNALLRGPKQLEDEA
ncbi:MAG: mechanosensitive ion channel domain-containing protein [Pseudomonadota bacterium]